MAARPFPNIAITGTPGTGKTSTASALLAALEANSPAGSWEHVCIGDLVKDKGAHTGWNEEWQSYDVDEDALLDELEIVQQPGGRILDWHTVEIFPERWIDLVVVLTCDHTLLWTRLEKRAYPLKKIQENNTAEIMQVVLEEAREAYAEEIVVPLVSETADQMEENVARIVAWVDAWKANNASRE